MRTLQTITICLALAAGSVVLAQPGERGFHRHGGPGVADPARMVEVLAARLQLTESQQAELGSILGAARKNAEVTRQEMQQARQALHEAIHGEVFDELAIRDAAAALATIEADLAVARSMTLHQIRAILTTEQLAELEEMRGLMRRLMGRGPGGPRAGRHHHRCPECLIAQTDPEAGI